jgi:hypothetical protein
VSVACVCGPHLRSHQSESRHRRLPQECAINPITAAVSVTLVYVPSVRPTERNRTSSSTRIGSEELVQLNIGRKALRRACHERAAGFRIEAEGGRNRAGLAEIDRLQREHFLRQDHPPAGRSQLAWATHTWSTKPHCRAKPENVGFSPVRGTPAQRFSATVAIAGKAPPD